MTSSKINPSEILQQTYQDVIRTPDKQFTNVQIGQLIDIICRCQNNRALTRLLMSCTLAKICDSNINTCMPYTEINQTGCFSGRSYDERYITPFISLYRLPCNSTTAFLTPALRNINQPLSSSNTIAGNDKKLYQQAVFVLEQIEAKTITAQEVLFEIVRLLVQIRNENSKRLDILVSELKNMDGSLPLSSDAIIRLISQHLQCKKTSRLPVLIVTAAYKTAENFIGESTKPLNAHNAADLQTHAIGDVEIIMTQCNDSIVTVYEMKERRVTTNDIDIAFKKISNHVPQIQNYLFVTTEPVEQTVSDYASQFYEKTGGTEIAILDCVGFLTHFLHFFHRQRLKFLEKYQELVLSEPNSAVSQDLKEAFLALRKTAECSNGI